MGTGAVDVAKQPDQDLVERSSGHLPDPGPGQVMQGETHVGSHVGGHLMPGEEAGNPPIRQVRAFDVLQGGDHQLSEVLRQFTGRRHG